MGKAYEKAKERWGMVASPQQEKTRILGKPLPVSRRPINRTSRGECEACWDPNGACPAHWMGPWPPRDPPWAEIPPGSY